MTRATRRVKLATMRELLRARVRSPPPLGCQVVELVEGMATENPMWSRHRIAAELAKLGHDICKDTVAPYLPTAPQRPGDRRR
jgi:hypothetical protein